jgi:hypothetical protein
VRRTGVPSAAPAAGGSGGGGGAAGGAGAHPALTPQNSLSGTAI